MKARTSLAALTLLIPLSGCVIDNAVETAETSTKVETNLVVETATADELATPWKGERQVGNLTELHRKTYTDFESTLSFGVGRMDIPKPGHQLPLVYASAGSSLDFTNAYPAENPLHGRWKVEKLQLVGTMHEPAGTAYDTKKGEWQRITDLTLTDRNGAQTQAVNVRQIPTRPLAEFEKLSLVTFRDGGNLEVLADGDRLHVVGAIRAMNANCIKCHKVEKGHLMGAFSYELRRLGKDEVAKAEADEANPVP